MPTMTTLSHVGWFRTVGRHGFNITWSVRSKRPWKTISSSCINVLVGHEAIGEAIIPAWLLNDMFGRKYIRVVIDKHKLICSSQQPWSTYALHIATFTSLSFVFDPLIIYLTLKATTPYSPNVQFWALVAQLCFMSASKVVKLIGLFRREPRDVMFLPVSILFGYFHGWIKLYSLFTLRMVCYSP